jgi:prepilin-type N-terminal cleavage/methylation domain-containing protein
MSPPGAKRGFSLIEALVALAVAAIALTALFALQQQLADAQRRHQKALELVTLQRNALALTEDLNPTLEPAGELELAGGKVLRWTSTPLTPPRTQTGIPSGEGRYELRLYRVAIVIADRRGGYLGRVDFDRMGWKPLRPTADAAPQ